MIKPAGKLEKYAIFVILAVLHLATPLYCAQNDGSAPLDGYLRINYQRQNSDYVDYGLWLWDEVSKPSTDWPEGATRFADAESGWAMADVELLKNASQVGFMIINTATGEREGESRVIKLKKGQKQVWIKENDSIIYDSPEMKIKHEILRATVIEPGRILVNFNTLKNLDISTLKSLLNIHDNNKKTVPVISIEQGENEQILIQAEFDSANAPLSLTINDKTVMANLHWKLIDQLFAYDGNDLGCTFHNGKALLKLWAPLATQVEVEVFASHDQNKLIGQFALTKAEKGIWTIQLNPDLFNDLEDLHGCYYQYLVTNPGKIARRVLDPYAKSMAAVTIDSSGQTAGSSRDFVGKAAIIDVSRHGKPVSKVNIANYQKREDAIIYEVHIRDFTSDPSIENRLNSRWGSYSAFIDRLSYIKNLGVTHIQLLPVMAWYFGDETRMAERELEYSAKNNNYNWGYDPHSYFSPDGAYSTDPDDPGKRIEELKELINAIHQAGMGVILDVVYTHMAQASFLNDIVPDYYFFQDARGNFLGDFGNNLATNRKMAEKLMIDSVLYWFKEYGIDGMRWDMMGDATSESVQNAYNAAASVTPHVLFIGEGWRTFKGHLEDPALAGKGADQDWMATTDNVGVFSDEIRNELKSGFGCEGEPMFLTGGKRNIARLFANIKAQPSNTPATQPGDMVQYIEAHDNLPVFDVIAQSIKKDPDLPENYLEIHKRLRLGNLIILTSQGTAFIHAGQEYGRSKQWRAKATPQQKFHHMTDSRQKPFKHPYFIHDSYDSSDAINMFDWKKADRTLVNSDSEDFSINHRTVDYTKGLIALRRSTDAFRHATRTGVEKHVKLLKAPEIKEEDLIIAWLCESSDGIRYYVFVNADEKSREISMSENLTGGRVIVDGTTAGTEPIKAFDGIKILPGKVILAPLTGAVVCLPGKKNQQ